MYMVFMLQGYSRDSHKKRSGDGTVRARWGVCCAVSQQYSKIRTTSLQVTAGIYRVFRNHENEKYKVLPRHRACPGHPHRHRGSRLFAVPPDAGLVAEVVASVLPDSMVSPQAASARVEGTARAERTRVRFMVEPSGSYGGSGEKWSISGRRWMPE